MFDWVVTVGLPLIMAWIAAASTSPRRFVARRLLKTQCIEGPAADSKELGLPHVPQRAEGEHRAVYVGDR